MKSEFRAEAACSGRTKPPPRLSARLIGAGAAGAFLPRTRFVNADFAPVQILVGGACDGGLGRFFGGHGDKGKAAGAAGGAIGDQIDLGDRPKSGEQVSQIVLS